MTALLWRQFAYWFWDTFTSVEFFSTVVGLVVGSWWISKMQARRASEEETVRWLEEKIEDYAERARQYWSELLSPDPARCSELASQLKVEIKFFYPAVNHLKIVKDKPGLKKLIRDLYHAATNKDYRPGLTIDINELNAAHLAIANASAELRKGIYNNLTT